jgi:hypothetical protein
LKDEQFAAIKVFAAIHRSASDRWAAHHQKHIAVRDAADQIALQQLAEENAKYK